MSKKPKVDLKAIEMLVLDVDGVLTDGRIITHNDGSESKCFHVLDGHGLRMWQRAGLKVAWLSGRSSVATSRRAEELQISCVLQDCHEKLPARDLEEGGARRTRHVATIGWTRPRLRRPAWRWRTRSTK
jgi:YrbI family 3-deoxy-D-manno-octulosonate 8-phosphate phosphatase